MTFLCLYISRWWRQTWDTAPYFTVVNQSEARISTEHGITLVTPCLLIWIREFIHAPKAQHGIAMVSVDKFLYPRNQTRCNKFIPCSYDVCQIMKHFCSFKSQIPLVSGLNHRINTVLLGRIAAARKMDGGLHRYCDVINNAPLSLYFTLMTSNMRYVFILHGS